MDDIIVNGKTLKYAGPLSEEQQNKIPGNFQVTMSAEKIEDKWHYWIEKDYYDLIMQN